MDNRLSERLAQLVRRDQRTRRPISQNEEEILRSAALGAVDPEAISREQISQLCSALVVLYAQMGVFPSNASL